VAVEQVDPGVVGRFGSDQDPLVTAGDGDERANEVVEVPRTDLGRSAARRGAGGEAELLAKQCHGTGSVTQGRWLEEGGEGAARDPRRERARLALRCSVPVRFVAHTLGETAGPVWDRFARGIARPNRDPLTRTREESP